MILIDNIEYTVPGNWGDLDGGQCLSIFQIIQASNGETVDFLRMKFLPVLLGLKDNVFMALDEAQIRALMPITEFLLEQKGNGAALSQQLTDNKLPTIFRKYHGPANGLANINFYEYTKLDSLYTKFCSENNLDFLYRMIATMYRPAKERSKFNLDRNYGGDIRHALAEFEATVPARTRVIKEGLGDAEREMIIHFFLSCRRKLHEQFPNIFKVAEDGDNKFGWAGVILSLAGTKFGDDEKTAKKPLYTIFFHLSMLETQRVDAERKARLAKANGR